MIALARAVPVAMRSLHQLLLPLQCLQQRVMNTDATYAVSILIQIHNHGAVGLDIDWQTVFALQ